MAGSPRRLTTVADRAGYPRMTMKPFNQRLRQLRPGISDAQRKVRGKIHRVWLGLGLREETEDP